jgi:hypothetical protein
MELHTVFLSVISQASQGKYKRNEVNNFFGALFQSVNSSVIILIFITDELTNKPKITDKSFINGAFPFVILLIN